MAASESWRCDIMSITQILYSLSPGPRRHGQSQASPWNKTTNPPPSVLGRDRGADSGGNGSGSRSGWFAGFHHQCRGRGRALQGEKDPAVEGRVRAMVQAMVNAFGGRHRARKAVTQAILAQGLGIEMMDPIVAFISAARTQTGPGPQPLIAALSPEQVFVMSRALMA